MKTTVSILTFIIANSLLLHSQTASYNDVAVIINTNSAISDSIGSYFVAKRDIPSTNIIRISSPVSEEIDSVQFQMIRTQIEAFLINSNLVESINYLVTTKGVPLKVKCSDMFQSASVESELSLILGNLAMNIGKYGRCVSPYYLQHTNFTRKQYGIYLVTRLDGYSFANVKGLIDRAGMIENHYPETGKFVFDMDPTWNTTLSTLNQKMKNIADTLVRRGLTVKLDTTDSYLTGEQQVIGYAGWGSNDRHTSYHGMLNNSWAPGAIAETYVSTSGRTFTAPAVYGQSLIADIISEGVTAVKGYVYEPYSSAMTDITVLFDLYTSGYTVAESYYSASPYLSWMDVVIGDPKFRLTTARLTADALDTTSNNGSGPLPVEIVSFTAVAKEKNVELKWNTATEINNYGFEVEKAIVSSQSLEKSWTEVGFVKGNGTTNAPKSYTYTDANVNGTVLYRLKQIDRNGQFEYSPEVEITNRQMIQKFALMQNYPNPFNPTTTISYQLAVKNDATLTVYDAIGREVVTLVNEAKEAGSYNVQFDGSKLSSGIYFCTLRVGNSTTTKKLTLMK